jgi:hypothetical protein
LELKAIFFCFLLACAVFSLCVLISDVRAIVPVVQEVVFWENGENTMVNVTVYHTPVNTFHYVDQIEVDIDGTITSYPVSQSSTTFTAQINLGQISGNPPARARAHCTIDGWSSWSSQQTIPELSLWITIPLYIAGTFAVIVVGKKILDKNIIKS